MTQPVEFDSVWISSPEHLDRFEEIVKRTSWLKRLLLLYDIPDDYPRIRMTAVPPWCRVGYEPAVCLSAGKLLLRSNRLLFLTVPYTDPFGARLENLQEVRLEIALSEIASVEPYDPPAAAAGYCRFPWTRLRTLQSGRAGDFLVCLGRFVLFSRQARDENSQLFQTLTEIIPMA